MRPPTRPLPDTHPEFTITDWDGFTEYRVEHWHLARDGSRRVLGRIATCSYLDAAALVLAAFWAQYGAPTTHPVLLAAIALALALLLHARFTQVLHESVLVFPTLGIQLETHRGHPALPALTTTVTRRFVPRSALADVVLHEGLRGWNVRYYLAALQRRRRRRAPRPQSQGVDPPSASGPSSGPDGPLRPADGTEIIVHVAFENILPYFPILKIVYLGVQQTLFPPHTENG